MALTTQPPDTSALGPAPESPPLMPPPSGPSTTGGPQARRGFLAGPLAGALVAGSIALATNDDSSSSSSAATAPAAHC
jgi:hypothetical protein